MLVADAEMVSDIFFRWREQGSIPGQDINFDFDNVTFVLNALDSLAGDDRFLELRKRRPQHRTLERLRRPHPGGPQGKRRGPQGEERGARRKHQKGHPGSRRPR